MTTTAHPLDGPSADVSPGLSQDELYQEAARRHGRDLARFIAGYERDAARRQELLQDVHLALWQSCATFRGQCSLRTWAYRVAHNVGATHIQRARRVTDRDCVALDEIEDVAGTDGVASAERRLDLERVHALIHRLGPVDREVMLLYLEDLDAASIGEITGLSANNVATKVHRIKKLLALQMNAGEAQP